MSTTVTTARAARTHRRHVAGAAWAALWALTAAPALQAQDLSGVQVQGYATGTFQIGCTTCPHYVLTLSGNPTPFDGGPGAVLAGFDYSGVPLRVESGVSSDYTLGGSVSMMALAAFEGPLATPRLGAYAMAENVQAFIVTDLDVPIGIDYYSANATAESFQRYTWTGAAPVTLTFDFSVDGTIKDSRSSIGASAAFYGNNFEVPLASGSYFVQGDSLLSPATPVNGAFSVAMGFNPGDSFYLAARLTASVNGQYASGDTFSDAAHTLVVTGVSGGDTSLLIPSIAAAVPEPSAWALWLAGLGVLGALHRRRVP